MSELARVALIQDAAGLRTHVQLMGGVDPRALLMLAHDSLRASSRNRPVAHLWT